MKDICINCGCERKPHKTNLCFECRELKLLEENVNRFKSDFDERKKYNWMNILVFVKGLTRDNAEYIKANWLGSNKIAALKRYREHTLEDVVPATTLLRELFD